MKVLQSWVGLLWTNLRVLFKHTCNYNFDWIPLGLYLPFLLFESILIFLDAHCACIPILTCARPSACLPACPSQLALGKDNITAHPLRPMSYWFLLYKSQFIRHSSVIQILCLIVFIFNINNGLHTRVGPIYRLADIFDRYRYRYRYIGSGKLDIGIGHIGIGICIGYSGYRLYRYRPNIG
jgi:hypothetical protein